jgi:excisionase family DNA binding protein
MSDRVKKTSGKATAKTSRAGRAGEEPRQAEAIDITVNGVRVPVSPELEAAVHRAYKGLVEPLPREMTTTQAADFLDVSRPFVIKLINQRKLPCRMVGKHRRIPTDALLEYREKMFQEASQAAAEITQLAQASGLYDQEPPRNPQ